uniref:Phytocyanin domain-containing protein n=1 Tax=Leersia perrieri TaxID=77586 RepID=A0A0D9UZJ0_9ORYZ
MAAPMMISFVAVLLLLLLGCFIHAAAGVVDAAAPAPSPSPAPSGLVFHVGGPRGWRVPDADTSYGWWATNNRFHVGDSLYFRYGSGDSVLVVDREAFDGCDATAPVAAFADGATTVRLDRPGFFCFISGAPGHCDEGQKLVVRVMVHPADASASAPAAAHAPATSQPGHGGGGGGGGGGGSGASSSSSAAGAAVAAAAMDGLLVVLMLL